jgi:hypothetical protein
MCLPGRIEHASYGPGAEKICNHLAFLTLENCINQPSVVFGVGEHGFNIPALRIKVTETNLQTEKEKTLPILKTFAVLAYHGAPVICDLRQAQGTGFQLDQVVQCVRDEFMLCMGDR